MKLYIIVENLFVAIHCKSSTKAVSSEMHKEIQKTDVAPDYNRLTIYSLQYKWRENHNLYLEMQVKYQTFVFM